MSVAIVASGAVASLEPCAGEVGERARVAVARDATLEKAGLQRPFCARAPERDVGNDPATSILRAAARRLIEALDRARPGWRRERIGLALATSSGGMFSAERVFRLRAEGGALPKDLAEGSMYFGPMRALLAHELEGATFAPSTLVLSACAASTIAIGLGARWLERGACDLVLAGGFDAVTNFVAAGFEALRATSASAPRPFSLGRDGMALGEGAAIVALARSGPARAWVRGFGASGDAGHLTAPDREGSGLVRAAERALTSARMDAASVDLVSAHATATPFNDAAEARALRRVFGARAVPVHAFKAQIGHTLGAAGALESLAAVDAIERGVVPASVQGDADPDAPATLLARAEERPVRAALKLSAAFGGANAALVLTDRDGPSRLVARAVYASRAAHVAAPLALGELASRLNLKLERLGRACELSVLALSAAAELAREHDLRGAGVVVGHAYATFDINEGVHDHIVQKRRAEPHRFPYTTPGAVAGEVSLALGLTGPNVVVGSGLHGGLEALCVAAELVRAGDCDRAVVIAVDAPGPATRAAAEAAGWPATLTGSVALLVSSDKLANEITAWSTSSEPCSEPRALGHAALLPLTTGAPGLMESWSPQGRASCKVDRASGTEYA